MVSPRAGGLAGAPDPMAPASPDPKRPRQREQTMPAAVTRDVTLPHLVAEVAGLHARFARDEVFVTGVHEAVDDQNALILGAVLARLDLLEGRVAASETAVAQLGVDGR